MDSHLSHTAQAQHTHTTHGAGIAETRGPECWQEAAVPARRRGLPKPTAGGRSRSTSHRGCRRERIGTPPPCICPGGSREQSRPLGRRLDCLRLQPAKPTILAVGATGPTPLVRDPTIRLACWNSRKSPTRPSAAGRPPRNPRRATLRHSCTPPHRGKSARAQTAPASTCLGDRRRLRRGEAT